MSFDTGVNDASAPAVQLLLDTKSLSATQGFLEAAGRPELATCFEHFVRKLPDDWYACYQGVFLARETANEKPWLRVECLVNDTSQQAYAHDADALRAHLERVGLNEMGDDCIASIQELARSPFPLEFQFNVDTSGCALPVLSASLSFQAQDWTCPDGLEAITCLFRWMREKGLADERWEQPANTAFANSLKRADKEVQLYCYPAFLKLRWQRGLLPDAKAYLIAGAISQ